MLILLMLKQPFNDLATFHRFVTPGSKQVIDAKPIILYATLFRRDFCLGMSCCSLNGIAVASLMTPLGGNATGPRPTRVSGISFTLSIFSVVFFFMPVIFNYDVQVVRSESRSSGVHSSDAAISFCDPLCCLNMARLRRRSRLV